MSRRAHFAPTLLAALAALGAASKPPAPEPPAVGVTVREMGGARLVQAVLPGELLGAVLPLRRGGGRRILLLAAPENNRDGPRQVYELALGPEPKLDLLRDGLSAGLDAIDALDIDDRGEPQIVLGEPGHLYRLAAAAGAPASSATLLERDGFDLRSPASARLRAPAPDRRRLVTTEPGRLRTFIARGGAIVSGCEAALPLEAKREDRGLLLSTPQTTLLERGGEHGGQPLTEHGGERGAERDGQPAVEDGGAGRPGDSMIVAVGPQAFGPTRLRTRLVELEGEAGKPCPASDAWSRLPSPERVEGSWYFLLDGSPMLAVATTNAEKLGFFEDLKLRLFALAADRTRVGHPPTLAIETTTKRWRQIEPRIADLDGDGHDDLVLIEPEGLKGKRLRVEAYLGQGGGRFAPRPLVSTLDVAASAWSYGADLDGDGIPDLVVWGTGKLTLFTGIRPGRGGGLDEKPRRTVDLGTAERTTVTVEVGTEGVGSSIATGSELATADLDGRGRSAVLLLTVTDRGRGVLRVVRF